MKGWRLVGIQGTGRKDCKHTRREKAKDLNIIDIREISILADYFVICSGTSTTHIKTLADEVEEKMLEAGIELLHKEGYNSARWILLDYGEVVVHIFHEEDRQFLQS